MSAFHAEAGAFHAPDVIRPLLDNHHQQQVSAGQNAGEVVRSEFFGASHIQKVLAQPGVTGVRAYHAKRWEDANGNPTKPGTGKLNPRVVLVGVDAKGNDVINNTKMAKTAPAMMLAMGPVCPPDCNPPTIA
jgi:hypothetical protein